MDIEDIYSFLIEIHAVERSELSPEIDLCYGLGIDGDDFFELEEEFMKRYSINMDSYQWHFHHGEEGWNLGAIFFPAPYMQVDHIAVTPAILFEAATTKKWPIEYPEQILRNGRPDITFNKYFSIILITFLFLFWLFNNTA